MNNKKGFILSTYVYMLLVFFLLLLTTMLSVMNNTKLLSNKLKEQSSNTSGLIDKDFSFVLLGEGDMIIKKGEEYIEPGFKIQTSKKKDLSDIVNITGNVDVNNPNTYKLTYSATYNGITKKLTRNVTVLDNIASNYITGLYNYRKDENNLINPKAIYNNVEYDTGIRYTGSNPNNYVYYNCEDKDSNNVSYGEENYDYKSSCEVWRMIGVFDVSNGTTTEKRVKLINTASTFTSSWDSSASSGDNAANSGWGINQWGESIYSDGTTYEGADLMQLLNGYYIGAENSTCTYCNGYNQFTCSKICTAESLKSANMKPLTSKAKSMIENAVWDTYGVDDDIGPVISSNASEAYLQEKGINAHYTGKSECENIGGYDCNDTVVRTTNWIGLVGLMAVSDIGFANGWLHSQTSTHLWSITPRAHSSFAYSMWCTDNNYGRGDNANYLKRVPASTYLSSAVKITSGDGTEDNPYKLSI